MEWVIPVFLFLCFLLFVAIAREEGATNRLNRERKAFTEHVVEMTAVINDNAEITRKMITKVEEAIFNQAFIDARVNLLMEAFNLKLEVHFPEDDTVSKLKITKNLGAENP